MDFDPTDTDGRGPAPFEPEPEPEPEWAAWEEELAYRTKWWRLCRGEPEWEPHVGVPEPDCEGDLEDGSLKFR